jgi:hypothetical protein
VHAKARQRLEEAQHLPEIDVGHGQ